MLSIGIKDTSYIFEEKHMMLNKHVGIDYGEEHALLLWRFMLNKDFFLWKIPSPVNVHE